MKTNLFIFCFSFFLMISCSKKSNKQQCNFYKTNIDLNNEIFTHSLSDAKYDYLFGSLEEDLLDYRTNEITIERSKVGNDKKWASFSNKIPGSCEAVCQTKEYIYLISNQQYQKPQDIDYTKHKLYKISKENGLIDELYEWNIGTSVVNNIFFESDKKGYIFFTRSVTLNPEDQILRTFDGGKTWDIIDLKIPILKTKFDNNKLYFLSFKSNFENNWIYSIDKNNYVVDSLQFDINILDFTVEKNGSYWLLGKDGERSILYHYENGKSKEIHSFPAESFFISSASPLYKYGNTIIVIGAKIDKNLLWGLGGTKPLMYVSKDNGLTWSETKLGKAFYLNPVSFYKDERLFGYIGLGGVLRCNFKKNN